MRFVSRLRLRVTPPATAAAMPCCADSSAASLFVAALLHCCGCAQRGETPLHYAAYKGHVACAALLVERGANKNTKDEVRWLHCAAPSPAAAAAACCIGTAVAALRCAALRSAEARPKRAAHDSGTFRHLSFISVCLLQCARVTPLR
jgi:hypothetical protein